MHLFKKFRKEIFLILFLSVLYFLFRLINLNSLPIFTDEAIYIRWAQIALHDSSWRFISLTDGKQPMYVWVAMIFIKFFEDPLLAGRLVSVLAGFFTMIGLFFLTYELFKSKTIAFLSSTLYIFYPFAQVLDRMALYDSMVAAFYVWALYFSILLVRKVRLDLAFILGFVIGGGVLTKSSNFFSIYLLPFLLILFDFKKKDSFPKLLKFVGFSIFASGIAFLFYSILRLSPLYQMIEVKNSTFIYPFGEWLSHPFVYFQSNFSGLVSWLFQYLTYFYLILILISILFIKKFLKEKLLLILYFVLPFLALSLFGKLIYPRFIFLMSLMLLPLAAWSIEFLTQFVQKRFKLKISKNWLLFALTVIFIVYPAFVSIQFAYEPLNSHIADRDRNQYINGWAAGWGVDESIKFFKKEAENKKIFVATEGTFGLMPEAMEIYLINNKNVVVKGYWPISIFPKEVEEKAKVMPTYFIFYQPEHKTIPSDYPLKLIFKVKQGSVEDYYRVYQVLPR